MVGSGLRRRRMRGCESKGGRVEEKEDEGVVRVKV